MRRLPTIAALLAALALPARADEPAEPGNTALGVKIDGLLARFETASPTDWAAHFERVRSDLAAVGDEALPILERAVTGTSYERAKAAGALLGSLGGERALPALERIVRTGDPLSSGAAILALRSLPSTPEANRALVATVDRLLQDLALASRHRTLIDIAKSRMDGAALMERHARGGPYAHVWLMAAIDARAPGAASRAFELARSGAPYGDDVATYAVRRVNLQPNQRSTGYYDLAELRVEDLRALADRQVALGATDRESVATTANVLRALALHASNERGASDAWARMLRTPLETRRLLVSYFYGPGGAVPADLFDDPARSVEVLRSLLPREPNDDGQFQRLPREVAEKEGFWKAVSELLSGPDHRPQRDWLVRKVNDLTKGAAPPPGLDARWMEILQGLASGELPGVDWLAKAAARSADPRYLEFLRERLRLAPRSNLTSVLLWSLDGWKGPGATEFARAAATTLADAGADLRPVFRILGRDPAGIASLAEIARARTSALAPYAVQALSDWSRVDVLTQLVQAEQNAPERAAPYQEALIRVSQHHRLREAIPFLLREFKATGNPQAQQAMTAIRDHYDRVASFEEWLQRDAGKEKAELANLVSDPDPEIRRAAVLSIAALGDRGALPQLVRIAKEETDPRVRQAALEAVERLAKREEPKPAEKPPGAK